jgi:hypothetical protein
MIGRFVTPARPPTRPARNVFAPIITEVALVGLISLVRDGPGSCTLIVLKLEAALLVFSVCVRLLECRRSQSLGAEPTAGDAVPSPRQL